MASRFSDAMVEDPILLDQRRKSSPPCYRFDQEDDEDFPLPAATARPSVFERVLRLLAMSPRIRRARYDFDDARNHELSNGLLASGGRKRQPRETRRCRQSMARAFLKRIVVALPIVVLILFGVLHIVQVLIGRASLFWDVDHEDLLPYWGKLGHIGEGLVEYPTDLTRDVLPIRCHSHNDYWRRVPLFDAIYWGCTSVEVDVWLFDDDLFVGHNTASLTRNRTFQSLYVNPLADLLSRMNPTTEFANATGHGVFDVDPEQTLTLLVDLKTDGRDTFPYVSQQLEPLREQGYLTYYDGEKVVPRAVTVVGTGNTPFDLVVQNATYRDIFFDAPLPKLWEAPQEPIGRKDLGSFSESSTQTKSSQGQVGTGKISSADDFNTTNSYYASVSFTSTVGFIWRGHISLRQMDIIRGQIRGAKRRGLKVRYWDTPAWPIALRNHIWHVLVKEGADILNVDDLKSAATEDWKRRVHGWF